MSGHTAHELLSPEDPAPVVAFNAKAASAFLLLGDHAGDAVPACLGQMGLDPADLARHIAIDIGVRGLGEALAQMLDAPFLHQHYSRLVIDCNRDPASADAIPALADGTAIPGNGTLGEAERAARIAAIHTPYHAAIATTLDRSDHDMIVLALHSFTPVMAGVPRPWHCGILHWQGNTAFALRLLRALEQDGDLVVGDNQPYRMDATDYTIPHHIFPRGLAYAEIEIRQDLIADQAGQLAWARRIADALATMEMPPA